MIDSTLIAGRELVGSARIVSRSLTAASRAATAAAWSAGEAGLRATRRHVGSTSVTSVMSRAVCRSRAKLLIRVPRSTSFIFRQASPHPDRQHERSLSVGPGGRHRIRTASISVLQALSYQVGELKCAHSLAPSLLGAALLPALHSPSRIRRCRAVCTRPAWPTIRPPSVITEACTRRRAARHSSECLHHQHRPRLRGAPLRRCREVVRTKPRSAQPH